MADPGSLAATVVVPTYDHGATLLRSVGTALAQRVDDLEVLIVGDGVPADARGAVETLLASDPRIRFFDNPKGRRLGEEHRHRALAEARGEIVVYLCDDDLWRPDHVATMRELLKDADFAHTLPVGVHPTGELFVFPGDLALMGIRRRMSEGSNFIPLSCAGHTLEAYRRLPRGWIPAPDDLPSDLHFFQQWLSQKWCRAVSSHLPTTVHFPSPERPSWTEEQRLEELDLWTPLVTGGESWNGVVLALLAAANRQGAEADEAIGRVHLAYGELSAALETARAEHRAATETNVWLQQVLANAEEALAAKEEELAEIRRTATWRLRERLRAFPPVRRIIQPLVRLLAGGGGR